MSLCEYIQLKIRDVCECVYTELEIGGVASQNANHFRGNCESL